MQKYQLKAELYRRLSNKDILHLYATNANLIRRIDTENPQKLFSFLQFLSEWQTEAEILGYAHLDENDIADDLFQLSDKNYAIGDFYTNQYRLLTLGKEQFAQ